MMKKKLTLLVSLLLCLAMLLASCGGDPAGKNPPNLPPDDPDGGKTPAQLESAANELYKAAIAEWLKYIEYDAPEANADPEIVKSYLGSVNNGYDSVDYTLYDYSDKIALIYSSQNNFFEYTEPVEEPADPSAEPVQPTVTLYEYQLRTWTLLDLETGNEIKTWNSVDYDIGGRPAIYHPEKNRATDHVVYEVELLLGGAIVEVAKEVYVGRELTELEKEDPTFKLDSTSDADWILKTTYSYYDNAGNALAENLETRANVRDDLIDIGAYTYATMNGEIIRRFDLGMELPLPSLDDLAPIYDEYDQQLNDYFSSGDYHYLVTEKQMQVMPIGDLALYVLPGVSIQILDKEYKIVTEYISDSYSIMGYAVLPNGDVYVCEYEKLESDATEYDILQGEEKLNVIHTVVSASTGAVTTVEKGYVASKVYTEPMFDVTTPLQQATRGDFAGVCALKDGYMLANVQKFSDGVLSSDSVIAVLNGSLEIVAELPKVIPNQFGYVSFLNADQALISSLVEFSTDGSTVVYYSVDTKSGDLELVLEDKEHVTVIDGGYIYEEGWTTDSVYDYNWNKLYTFDEIKESWEIVDGVLLITYEENGNTYYYTGKIVASNSNSGNGQSVESFEFEKTRIADSYGSSNLTPYQGNRFFAYSTSSSDYTYIYDLKNELVFSFDKSETETLRDAEEPYNKYVSYSIERDFYIYELTDGVYYLELIESWRQTSYTGYTDPAQIPYPETSTVYSYYIIK